MFHKNPNHHATRSLDGCIKGVSWVWHPECGTIANMTLKMALFFVVIAPFPCWKISLQHNFGCLDHRRLDPLCIALRTCSFGGHCV